MNDLDIDLDRNTPWVDTSACVSSLVSIGPVVWPAIRNIDTDTQTDKHNAFYYIDAAEVTLLLYFDCTLNSVSLELSMPQAVQL